MKGHPETSDETPDLITVSELELADLGGPAAELSTGLILTWRERLVFALHPSAIPLGAHGRQDAAALVGIGGHLDPGEKWTQAARREAMEEASCRVLLGDSTATYLCRQSSAPQPLAYRWAEPQRPLLVWVATFPLRRGPERSRVPVTLVNAVFRAAALSRPMPGAEIKALVLLDQDLLTQISASPAPWAELEARGARVIGDVPSPETLIALGGSAFFYAQWLAWLAG